MFDVICIGNSSFDIFLSEFDSSNESFVETSDFDKIEVGSKIEFNKLNILPGGGAANSAISFARHGLEVGVISRIGQDAFGKRILNNFYKNGVDTKYIQVDKKIKSPTSVVILNSTGEKTIFIFRGSEKSLSEKLIDFNKLQTKWLYVTSLAGNFQILESIFSHANNNEIKIFFNPGYREIINSSIMKYLNHSDVVQLNLNEAKKLFDTTDLKVVLHKAKSIVKNVFLINDGENGTYLIKKDKVIKSNIITAKVKDLTGAGDAFGSGYLTGILKTEDEVSALKYGAYSAAQVVQKTGSQTNIVNKYPKNINLKIEEIKI